jgi:branched-chain amino acid transport system substrate-binding protein
MLITQDQVLTVIGFNANKQAISVGEVCNSSETPMVSPWSTNPKTSEGCHCVFQACFLDSFQWPVAAKSLTDHQNCLFQG